MKTMEKDWWAPIRNGLIVNPTGKHIRSIGPAMPLYLYLHLFADRKQGRLFRKYKTISEHMGIPERTLKHWMKKLEKGKYVELTRMGNGLSIQITKYKPIRDKGRSVRTSTSNEERSATFGDEKCKITSGEVQDYVRDAKNGTSIIDCKIKSKQGRSATTGTSKESIKESNKEREPHSLSESSKSAKKNSKSTPDIHLAIAHCKSEYQRIHGIENPEINGAECKVFQKLLKTHPIEKINSLTTGYLSLKDAKLREAGFPIIWFPNHINRLLMAENKPARELAY